MQFSAEGDIDAPCDSESGTWYFFQTEAMRLLDWNCRQTCTTRQDEAQDEKQKDKSQP
jgi:hypothetical protein